MKNFNFLKIRNRFWKRTTFFVVLLTFVSFNAFSQRVVHVKSGTELSAVILGDTTASGDRVDVNTVYELERGGFYPVAKELNLKTTLHIRAEEGTGALPAIYAQKDASNNYPKLINAHGNVILENLYLSNANGPDANPKWGGFRVAGENSRVILKGCQFEYDKASTVQFRANNIKLYMTNCIAGKTGNYAAYNGNGRLVDTRGYYADSIVVKNTTVYYMQDRVIRNMGGEINYLEFNHVTVVNNQGMHGCFAMAKVHHAKIVNNLVINGEYGGDRLNDVEQTGPEPDKKHIYMITMDTIYNNMTLEIHNNNFAFTTDLVSFFNSNDTIWKPMVLAPLVKQVLGKDTVNAYFEEPVTFNKMPDIPWDFLRAIYTNPQPSPMPNNWPDTIGISNINAGYANTYKSYTAAEGGLPLGDLQWFKGVIPHERIVHVKSGTELSSVILGDTTNSGDRVDVNTVYELERGGFYPVAKELNLKTTLHIRAEEGTGALPAIYAQKDASNKYPKLINAHGNVILEDLYLSNANGPDANPKWGGFRVAGENSRVILKGCQFEYDKASTVQFRANNIKLYMTNCIAAKTGNYAAYNGNGRLVDTRGYYADSIVVKNTTVYYMQDRVIRNMGGEINYLEFNHVTVVNNQGMHGCFAMAKVHHAKIVNNLVINGEYGGDRLNDVEQTGPEPDKKHIYMITMDTIYNDMTLEIHNNNFAFTTDLVSFFNSNDTIWKPMVLAPLVKQVLGQDTVNAYFEEPVTFNKMPDIPWDFLRAIYTNPQPSPMPNNWPDSIGISNIDAGYANTYKSYTAAEGGLPLGDLQWEGTTGIKKHNVNIGEVTVFPNPVKYMAQFHYNLKKTSEVTLTIYNITGQRIGQTKVKQVRGNQSLRYNAQDMLRGIYIYSLSTGENIRSGKLIIVK